MNFFSYESFQRFRDLEKLNKLWIFDIDDTLYQHCELTSKLRMEKYIEFTEKLGVPKHMCKDLIKNYSKAYGSAMKGLISNFKFTEWHFNQLDNPAKNTYHHLNKDIELNNIISKLDGHKICLTNGCINHAKNVLERLELIDEFLAVICCDFKTKNFICKPEFMAFEVVNRNFDVEPNRIFFYDDREKNVDVAKNFGWNAYLVDKKTGVKSLLVRGNILE